jgi:hypothetical protein
MFAAGLQNRHTIMCDKSSAARSWHVTVPLKHLRLPVTPIAAVQGVVPYVFAQDG